jgi:hypothetical protein
MDREQLAVKLFAPGISVIAVGLALAVRYFYPIVFEQGWIREARAVHAERSANGRIEGERRIEESHYLAEVRRFGAAPYIPDLEGAFLTLDRVALLPRRDGRSEALHAGYIERQGCRLTLWISKAGEADNAAFRDGAFGWTARGLRYVMVGTGFPEARLDVLGGVVARISRDGIGLSEPERRSLGLSAALNPPCRP